MGISWSKLQTLFEPGLLSTPKPSVLDIGCSNIHTLDADALIAFVRKTNDVYELDSLRNWAEQVAAGGVMDPEIGGANGAWLGDVLVRAGLRYVAFDIFAGYKTEIFDLSVQDLPKKHVGSYDLVLNFGTTEHLIGQRNAFKVMHEAAAVGGLIVHDLPMTGYLDHGYFSYNPMFFRDLAEANGYKLEFMKFEGSLAGESIAANLASGHPDAQVERQAPWTSAAIPTAGITVGLRKMSEAPFRVKFETTTTVGDVASALGGRPDAASARRDAVAKQLATLLPRARDPKLTLEELSSCYEEYVASGCTAPFALSLQRRSLELYLEKGDYPELTEQLAALETKRREQFPVLNYLQSAKGTASSKLAFDGKEAALAAGEPSLEQILLAYRMYDERSAVELFPLELEVEALLALRKLHPADKRLLTRLGAVTAITSPAVVIKKRR